METPKTVSIIVFYLGEKLRDFSCLDCGNQLKVTSENSKKRHFRMSFSLRGKGKTNHTIPENILSYKMNLKDILF